MSELVKKQSPAQNCNWQLLTTASSLALLAALYGVQNASAEDADRPTVWIELDADLARVNDGQQPFSPAFIANNPGSTAFEPVSPAEAQKPPRFSFGGEGKILFQPKDSNWTFSASVRYGRANGSRQIHQTAKNEPEYQDLSFTSPYFHIPGQPFTITPVAANFLGVQQKQSESHAVVDFQTGRDFGLGLFGREGTSVLNVGVRFAQFTSSTQSSLQARPDIEFLVFHVPTPNHPNNHGTGFGYHYHQYLATAQSARSFHGVGPSLSWNASAPFSGNTENGQLAVDWGISGSVLFGRQKAKVQHQATAQYFASNFAYNKYPAPAGAGYHHPQVNLHRSRSIIVPNLGGFAGISFNFSNVKVSAGYRGDFFFGAMDTGFDTAKRSTIGFYGPFASISVGL